MLLATGSIFLLCLSFFMIVHVWAWLPLNVATQFVPFSTTWKFAIVLAGFATGCWALPLKRALSKQERADEL